MKKRVIVMAFAFSVVLAGCATSPQDAKSNEPANTEPQVIGPLSGVDKAKDVGEAENERIENLNKQTEELSE